MGFEAHYNAQKIACFRFKKRMQIEVFAEAPRFLSPPKHWHALHGLVRI